MNFQLRPILAEMADLYRQPLAPPRFTTYLAMLQGNSKDNLRLPIMGYNPMAKPHVLAKISELQQIGAEQIMANSLNQLNARLASKGDATTIQVVLNLADDLKGGWTNRYTTDFDSKFKLNGLLARNFCAPYLWASEDHTPALITERTLAYAFRTLYRQNHPTLLTLANHLDQESYVYSQLKTMLTAGPEETPPLNNTSFFEQHQHSEEYNLIFRFFYGEEVAEGLGMG